MLGVRTCVYYNDFLNLYSSQKIKYNLVKDVDNHLLIFDSSCYFCKNLAINISRISKNMIKMRSLSCTGIRRLIQAYYGEFKHTYYLIRKNEKNIVIHRGIRVIPQIMKHLGFKNSLKLLYTLSTNGRHSCVRCSENKLGRISGHVQPARRMFLNLAILGLTSLLSYKLPKLMYVGEDNIVSSRRKNWRDKVRWKNKRMLDNKEKEKSLEIALNSNDVKNILKVLGGDVDKDSCSAMEHLGEVGHGEIRVLAVSFIVKFNGNAKYVISYYRLSKPIYNYISEAYALIPENNKIKPLAMSINGELLFIKGKVNNVGIMTFGYHRM
jgi:hypothetical protein